MLNSPYRPHVFEGVQQTKQNINQHRGLRTRLSNENQR